MTRTKYDEDFERFWANFKGRWDADKEVYMKVGKCDAQQAWRILDEDEKEHAIAVAHRAGGKYVPDACRWLKRKLFDDFTVKQ